MAAQSKTDVSNLALALIGDVPPELTDVDTDVTKSGKLCKLLIDNVRKSLLRSFIWNFAKVRTTLTLPVISGAANNGSGLIRITRTSHGFVTGNLVSLSEVQGTTEANGTWTVTQVDANNFDLQGSQFINAYVSGGYVSRAPAFEFIHQHALPNDFLRLVRLETPRVVEVDYRLEGGVIVTDAPVLELCYIKEVTDYLTMDPLFYQALAFALAGAVCYALTQSKPLKEQLREQFREIMSKARHTDSVEDPRKILQANEWLDSRIEQGDAFVRDPLTS